MDTINMRARKILVASAICTLILAGCGGGSDDRSADLVGDLGPDGSSGDEDDAGGGGGGGGTDGGDGTAGGGGDASGGANGLQGVNLWVAAPSAANVQAFPESDLTTAGPSTTAPAGTTISANLGQPFATAFDSRGNLWVADANNNNTSQLLMYTPQDLAAAASGGDPTASVTIMPDSDGAAPTLDDPTGLAFDSSGNLWVANFGNDSLIGYSSDQLRSNGQPVPDFFIQGTANNGDTTLDDPRGLAFDEISSDGVLWVANSGLSTLVAYDATTLSAATTGGGETQPTPTSAITDTPGLFPELVVPVSLAFDSEGDLWVSDGDVGNDLLEFSQSDLASGGVVQPNTLITFEGVATAVGIAFDADGDLIVADALLDRLIEVSADDLSAGGDIEVEPETIVSGFNRLGVPANLSFDPAPSSLPLPNAASNDGDGS